MDPTGANQTNLTNTAESEFDQVISPGGSVVVYVRAGVAISNIWIMTIDGNNQTQLTAAATDDQRPKF
jgi:Tol biopolymer transport system component